MNILKKILTITIILIIFMTSNIFALDKIFTDADDWETDGKNGVLIDNTTVTTIDDSKIKDISNKIYNIGFAVGIVVVFVVGAILGIKFITTGVEEKAEVKEALIPYSISVVVFFGAFGVWKLAIVILDGIADVI